MNKLSDYERGVSILIVNFENFEAKLKNKVSDYKAYIIVILSQAFDSFQAKLMNKFNH